MHNNIFFNHTYFNNKNKKLNINKIYVISLRQHIKQRSLIKKYLNKYNINFTFYDAIDGYTSKEICSYYDDYLSWDFDDPRTHPTEKRYRRKLIKSPGAIGLLKTYEKILEENINQKNIDNILIFEDDILIDNEFNEKLNKIFETQKSIEMLYLGCSQHVWNNPDLININNVCSIYESPIITDGSFATIFNKNVFSTLLNSIKKVNAPIDLCMRDVIRKYNCYTVYPNIVVADTTRKSSISNLKRNLRDHKNKVKWDLKNIDFSRGILKVSVIIANYNSENTIEYTLESIKQQTYNNIEVVLVDDNSTDNSVKIIKDWININKNIDLKLIELKNNVGAYTARNIALKESCGFFITILDSDDVFLPPKIEHDVYNYFNYEKYEVFFSKMYRSQNISKESFKNISSLLTAISKEREPYNKINNYPWNYKFRFGFPTIFVEKDFFEKYGVWNEKYRFGMDVELIQRYIIKKYNEFIDHKSAFKIIYENNCDNYDIYVSDNMNYVSFPMNQNNATNICTSTERENIHDEANKELIKFLDAQII
jgi:glycosyltransferase involved in cell wall biosynthesis/GR25 family glycosyltransferase involved in LPS biosynthesis